MATKPTKKRRERRSIPIVTLGSLLAGPTFGIMGDDIPITSDGFTTREALLAEVERLEADAADANTDTDTDTFEVCISVYDTIHKHPTNDFVEVFPGLYGRFTHIQNFLEIPPHWHHQMYFTCEEIRHVLNAPKEPA